MVYGGLFDLDKKIKRLKDIHDIMNREDFWNSSDKDDIIKENKYLSDLVGKNKNVLEKIKSNIEMISQEIDEEMFNLLKDEYEEISHEVDKLRIDTYLSGEYDKNDCLLEIHSGAGGTESCDWVSMLARMYMRYLVKNGYSYIEIDKQAGEEVGFKSILIKISGDNAYGYFKGETGIHRLVRISPFDANKRRHTTFASVEVIPEFDQTINVSIDEKDLRVDIFRSSGPGGQGVNTTDSAVRITHIPTGIVVSCQNERSQIRNKQLAMEVLKNKLYKLEVEDKNKELLQLRGDKNSISFGNAKRSYVMCPYTLVKDNVSGYESSNVDRILDGDIGEMLEANIRR